MERDSNKHSPRLDEEMKREVDPLTRGAPVDSRAAESRASEPAADGERQPDQVGSTTEAGTGSLTPQEVELRQDLARFLDGKIFPATQDDVLANARSNGAPEHVTAWFKRLPNRTYEGFPEVWETGSGHDEPRAL